MSAKLQRVLKSKVANGWRLFALLSVPMSIIIFATMMRTDMSTGEGVSDMIGYSVRWAVPFLFVVIAASSVQVLFPGPVAMWWLRNRKYLGLVFAVAMAWQGLFIFIVSSYFREYYFEEIYLFRDELEGTIGYVFLTAMIVTSFHFGRKYVDAMQWNLIHTAGVTFLWAYAFSVYWWNLFYYPTVEPFSDPRPIDFVYYWMGFTAFALRIAAWGKKRYQVRKSNAAISATPIAFKAVGGALVAFGLVASATGQIWWQRTYQFLAGPGLSEELVLWLPFWPLEPFLPLIAIGLGVMLATTVRPQAEAKSELGRLTE